MDIDLKYLIDSGIIDVPNIQSIIEMKKRQELLNNHPYKIWCGSNGKWYTYLPDEEKGRIYSICKKIGVYKKSPHKIRATYDTILLDNGVDKRTVKDQMGHSDISVSEKSYHRNRKSIKNKAVIIDAIADFRTA